MEVSELFPGMAPATPPGRFGLARRWWCRLIWMVFGDLMIVVKKFRDQPCYWRTMFLYYSLTPKKQQRCTINIVMDVRRQTEPWGHVWLTLDGKNYHQFRRKPKNSEVPPNYQLMGSSGIIRYWVAEPEPPADEVTDNGLIHRERLPQPSARR